MASSLSDLNNHLFAQLERLAAGEMTSEQIDQEAKRAQAIVSVADQIITNANLQLNAAKLFANHGQSVLPMLPKIGDASR